MALKPPIKDRMAVHVFGGATDARAEIRCVFGESVPSIQSHPKIIVFLGHIQVFEGDKVKLF